MLCVMHLPFSLQIIAVCCLWFDAYSLQHERNFIMQVICEATQVENTKVKKSLTDFAITNFHVRLYNSVFYFIMGNLILLSNH